MEDHNNRTHDRLVRRVKEEFKKRWRINLVPHYHYSQGEMDLVRFQNGSPTVAYEIKSNNLNQNMFKAHEQLERFHEFHKNQFGIYVRGVYITQKSLDGDLEAYRMI